MVTTLEANLMIYDFCTFQDNFDLTLNGHKGLMHLFCYHPLKLKLKFNDPAGK